MYDYYNFTILNNQLISPPPVFGDQMKGEGTLKPIPAQNAFHEIPCLVQSERQWIRELKMRFSSLEQVAFRCSCGHVQTVKDLMEQNIPLYKVFLECTACGRKSHEVENIRLIYRENQTVFFVFDFGDQKKWE